MALSPLPQWVKTKASREWSPTTHSKTSLVSLAQRYYDSHLVDSERKRQSSITTAKSNAVKAREQHEKTVREFESKRDSFGLKLNEAQGKLAQLESQKATKSKPQVVTSSYFEDTKNTPSSIYGRTKQESNQAETTYETAQQQQKSLFDKVTGATSWNEAIRIRKQSMESNPYLGTANTLFHKGKAIGSSGALLSLSLETVSLDGVTEEPLFTRRKKEKDFLESLDDNERLNYGRNKNGDLVLLSDDSLAVPEIQLEQSYSQPEPRFTVTTPDGKIRTFKDEKTADEFMKRIEASGIRYEVETPDGKIRTFKEKSHAEKFIQRTNQPDIETTYAITDKYGKERTFNSQESLEKFKDRSTELFTLSREEYVEKRTAEEIAIAGGTYGDYLKTVNLDSFDSQLKFVGKGAKRAFNSYTSIVGIQLHNSKVVGESLLDYAISDTYNPVHHNVLKPTVDYLNPKLEKMGMSPIHLDDVPKNYEPYQKTSKAWNSRTPAENVGDIITTGAVEAGLFVTTAGLGNLAIRGAGKLPYLLKHSPLTPSQYLKQQKESQIITKKVKVDDGGTIDVLDFEAMRLAKTAPHKSTKAEKLKRKAQKVKQQVSQKAARP